MNTSDVKWKVAGVIWKVGKWVTIATVFVPAVILILLLIIGLFLKQPPAQLAQASPVQHFENNYRPGTEGYALTKLASEAFPYLDILISDERFLSQMTEASKQAHPRDAMRLVHRIGQHEMNSRAITSRGSVLGSMAWEKEFLNLNVCLVYLTSEGMSRGLSRGAITVFHESIHCSRAKMHQDNPQGYSLRIAEMVVRMPTFKSPGALDDHKLMGHLIFVGEEAFVTASERSQSFEPGPVGRIAAAAYEQELSSARLNSRANESPNVAMLIESLCAKAGDCPTEAPALSRFLSRNDAYIAALDKDLQRWLGMEK